MKRRTNTTTENTTPENTTPENTTPAGAMETALASAPVVGLDPTWATRIESIKSDKIREIALEFTHIAQGTTGYQVKAAILLDRANSMGTEAFKREGFTGLADMAETLFRVKKSAASQLAAVGRRFYRPDDKRAPELNAIASMLPPYTLYELRGLSNDELVKAYSAGEITATLNQAGARELVKKLHPATTKDTVVPTYAVRVTIVTYGLTNTPAHVAEHEYTGVAETELDAYGQGKELSVDGTFTKPDGVPDVGDGKNLPSPVDGWKTRAYMGVHGFSILNYKKEEKRKRTDAEEELARIRAQLEKMGITV